MRLNIKDIAKILDMESIPFSKKKYWIELYFNNFRAYKTSDQIDGLIEILNSKWFTKILPESWKDDKTCASSCRNWCTEGNDPAITRIKK